MSRDPRALDGSLSPAYGSLTRPPILAVMAAALVPLAFFVDLPISRYCMADGIPGDLRRILDWSELLAHGSGVAIIAGVIWVLDPARRRCLPRLLTGAYAAGLTADIAKLMVARVRPRHFDFNLGVFDTFVGWLPFLGSEDGVARLESRFQSFPSAHTAVAVALAYGLARVYPHGRMLFLLLAVLAAGQRIESGSHYLSDTLAGAAVGAAIYAWCNSSGLLERLFVRIESP